MVAETEIACVTNLDNELPRGPRLDRMPGKFIA